MRLIRRGTFETNSSSTHSITMCSESEFDKFKNGEMVLVYDERLIPKEEVEDEINELRQEFIDDNPDFDENDEDWKDRLDYYICCNSNYYTYNGFCNLEYEHFEDRYTTPNGETIVAFGYYGYDY